MRTVDVSTKPETFRLAKAYGRISLGEETIRKILEGCVPKGDVLSACKLAGIMASKRTGELLPFCHPIPLEHVEVEVKVGEGFLEVFSTVLGTSKTGYEMEALTAVSVALLTVYDMCKGLDSSMVIEEIKLLEKHGGKSQWSKSLEGKKVFIKAEQEHRPLIEEYLRKLSAQVVEDGESQIIFTTQKEDFDELFGISSVINNHLFSVLPSELRDGVRIGRKERILVVQLEPSEKLIRAFFESFGEFLGNL
ncbi:cyclic pyranopterin monophosphate synthase MoaC [Thermocrinis sp.]